MAAGSKVLPNGAHSTQGLVQENQARPLVPGMVPPTAKGPVQRLFLLSVLCKLVLVTPRPASLQLLFFSGLP